MRRLLMGLTAAMAAMLAVAAPVGAIVYGQPAAEGEFDNVGALIAEFEGALSSTAPERWSPRPSSSRRRTASPTASGCG